MIRIRASVEAAPAQEVPACPAALTGPAVVAKRAGNPEAERDGQASLERSAAPIAVAAPPPANDHGKPAPKTLTIVTARKPGKRNASVPDLTPEEHKRRGDAAGALFREIQRRIAKASP